MVPSQSLILKQLLVNDVRPWSVRKHLTDGLLSTHRVLEATLPSLCHVNQYVPLLQRNPNSYSTQIQETENGPFIETIAKLIHQLHILQIEFHLRLSFGKMSKSVWYWQVLTKLVVSPVRMRCLVNSQLLPKPRGPVLIVWKEEIIIISSTEPRPLTTRLNERTPSSVCIVLCKLYAFKHIKCSTIVGSTIHFILLLKHL